MYRDTCTSFNELPRPNQQNAQPIHIDAKQLTQHAMCLKRHSHLKSDQHYTSSKYLRLEVHMTHLNVRS